MKKEDGSEVSVPLSKLSLAAHQPFEPLFPLDENPWNVTTDIALRTRTRQGEEAGVYRLGRTSPEVLAGKRWGSLSQRN